MSPTSVSCRRASIDDLSSIEQLARRCDVDPTSVSRRLTDFHLLIDSAGLIQAAIGLQVAGQHARWYRWLSAPEQDEASLNHMKAPMMKVFEANQITHLWTTEKERRPEWLSFEPPSPDIAAQRPAAFPNSKDPWLHQRLREPVESVIHLEQQLQLFQEAQRRDSAARLAKLKWYRMFAWMVFLAALLGCLALGIKYFNQLTPRLETNPSHPSQTTSNPETTIPSQSP